MFRTGEILHTANDVFPSPAWLFAQLVLGKRIPSSIWPSTNAIAVGDECHDRELLEWAAEISTDANDKLHALRQKDARQRDMWRSFEQFREAESGITEWNEGDHPRAPKGTSAGGQWVDKGGGASVGTGRSASSKVPRDNGLVDPHVHMLELAHTWWQTKSALSQTVRDIEDLPRRIAGERAQLGSGGRYAYLHAQNLVKLERNLETAKALAPELQKQLGELEQQYRDSGYADVPYSTFTPAETIVGGMGIEQVGRAVAMGGTPAGLQSTGIEFDVASTILAGPAILRLGKAVLGRSATIARTKVPSQAVTLKPYRGSGGGHHIPAKRAFEGAARYDANAALAIPRDELARLGVKHSSVTGAQQTLYREFGRSGERLSWEVVERIETEALVRAGLDSHAARTAVNKAIEALKRDVVPGPTTIPWGS